MTNVLITGANRGLGLGFVKKYLEKNVNIFCTTRDVLASKVFWVAKKNTPTILKFLS